MKKLIVTIIVAVMLILVSTPSAATMTCSSFDINVYCCPSACLARRQPGSKENTILRTCMVGLYCSPDEVQNASVFQMCHCP